MLRRLRNQDSRGFREAIRALRVAWWFEHVRFDLNVKSAYAVGRLVQPWRYKSGTEHTNRWAKYARAGASPGPSTVSDAEVLSSRSAQIFRSCLWQTLDSSDTARFGTTLQGSLSNMRCTKARLRRLAHDDHVDALAALVFLLRKHSSDPNSHWPLRIGVAIYRWLLASSITPPVQEIRHELCAYFEDAIFSLARTRDIALAFSGEEFEDSRDLLIGLYTNLLPAPIGLAKRTFAIRLMHGDHGYFPRLLFAPHFAACSDHLIATTMIKSFSDAKAWARTQLSESSNVDVDRTWQVWNLL